MQYNAIQHTCTHAHSSVAIADQVLVAELLLQIPRPSSKMALPRWVLSERVDSVAMLSAFDEWRSANPDMAEELGLVAGLPTIMHGNQEDIPGPDAALIEVPCPRGARCWRCRIGKAGYTFRWFSCLWLDSYMDKQRQGSWLPGDPEGYRITFPGQRGFRGEILSSRGHMVVEEIGEMESSSEESYVVVAELGASAAT